MSRIIQLPKAPKNPVREKAAVHGGSRDNNRTSAKEAARANAPLSISEDGCVPADSFQKYRDGTLMWCRTALPLACYG